MFRRSRLATAVACLGLTFGHATLRAQSNDPKGVFTEALARFSLALEGPVGDEGPAVEASLAAMDRIRQQWDALVQTYESGMARDIAGATADLAVRMHLALAGVYLDRQRLTDAARELGEAIRLNPMRADALALRGLIESQLTGRPQDALEDFGRAATQAPNDAALRYLLARQAVASGQAERATTALRQFVAAAAEPARDRTPFVRLGLVQEVPGIEPFFPPAPYAEAYRLLAEGRHDEAIARMKAAAAIDPLVTSTAAGPRSAEAHRRAGLAALVNDDGDRGLQELRDAARIDPAYERPRIDLARALFDGGQYGEAVSALTDALRAIPTSGRARYLRALAHQKQGNYGAAMDDLEQAAALRPLLGLNSIYQTLGALRRSQQDYDGAIAAFSQRIALVPNDPAAHQELADMYFRRSLLDEALAEYAVAVMLDPSRGDPYVGIAQVHLRESRFEEAAAAARRAVAIDGRDKQARYLLGTSLLRLGRNDESSRELEEYQRLQAEATTLESKRLELGALRREATVSAANGNHDRAVELLRTVLDATPGDSGSELDLGLALLHAGQASEAVAHLRAGASAAGADVHRYLAEAYAAAGQTDESARERALYVQARRDALRRVR